MSVSRSNKTQSDFMTRTQNGNTLLSIQSPLHGLVFCEIALLMRQFWDRCSFVALAIRHFEVLRETGLRWLSKCILGLFCGTNLPPC